MQVNYEVPTIPEMHSIRLNAGAMKKAETSLEKDLAIFDKILADFFWFYGQRYQIWNHVISLRWVNVLLSTILLWKWWTILMKIVSLNQLPADSI